jgi:hypothetical protein
MFTSMNISPSDSSDPLPGHEDGSTVLPTADALHQQLCRLAPGDETLRSGYFQRIASKLGEKPFTPPQVATAVITAREESITFLPEPYSSAFRNQLLEFDFEIARIVSPDPAFEFGVINALVLNALDHAGGNRGDRTPWLQTEPLSAADSAQQSTGSLPLTTHEPTTASRSTEASAEPPEIPTHENRTEDVPLGETYGHEL